MTLRESQNQFNLLQPDQSDPTRPDPTRLDSTSSGCVLTEIAYD
jgi:hypothetical protein